MTNIKFDLNDISLVPAVLSTIRSRKDLVIKYDGIKERKTGLSSLLPLIVSPMDTVINDKNTMCFYGMLTCSIRKETPEYTAKYSFISVSFEQFIAMCGEEKAPQTCLGILIDIANGHMKDLYDYVQIFKTNNPNIPLMVGNIANPETYRAYCNILTDIDFVRIGIGGGCFTPDALVQTENGLKSLQDIKVNDKVLTHTGQYKKVLEKHYFNKTEKLLQINNLPPSTKTHEYFVINKSDKDIVNDNNYLQYGFWLPANELDAEQHLLIKL